MTPLTLPSQTTLFSQVEVQPDARTTSRYWDYWGTQVTVFDLHEPHEQLEVTATQRGRDRRRPQPLAEPLGWDELRAQSTWTAASSCSRRPPLTAVDDAARRPRPRELAADARPADAALAIAEWVRAKVAYVPRRDRRADQRPGGLGQRARASARTSPTSPSGMLRSVGHPGPLRLRLPPPEARRPRSARPVEGQSHAWVEWWVGELGRLRPDQRRDQPASGT